MSVIRTTEEIVSAIEGTAGLITHIAKKLGCSWHTADNLVKLNEETKTAYKNEKERILDIAEAEQIKAIQNGDLQTGRWYLSKKGSDRGYGEKIEFEFTKLDELIESIKKI